MNRRGFFWRIAAVFLAAKCPPPAPPPLAFHPDAFSMVSDPLTGISMRVIQQWEAQAPCRLDMLYGFGAVKPDAIVVLEP